VHDHDGVGEDPVQHQASGHEATAARLLVAAAGLLALLAYGWWAVARPPFSGTATAAVLAAGGAAAVAGTAASSRRRAGGEVRRAIPWLVLVGATAAWQLVAYWQQPRHEHPTLSSLANALLDSQPARAVAFLLWVLATVHLARR
jgi:hypothetical protein